MRSRLDFTEGREGGTVSAAAPSRASSRPRAAIGLRSVLGATILAVLALLALAPSGARASARFTYELCDSALPGGGNPTLSFAVNPGVPIGYFNNCAAPGGSIGLSEWGHTAATFAFLSVEVPGTPGGFVETETISAAAGGFGPGNDHTFVYNQGWPLNNAGEETRTFFVGREAGFLGDGSFWLLLNCNGNYAPGCEAGPTIWAHYIAATEVDPNAPTLAGLQGSLLAGGVVRGHQALEVEAKDKGGGLSAVAVLVNGLQASPPTIPTCALDSVANRSYKGVVALSVTPCPSALKAKWTLDTETYPFHNGANAVQVCASDLSTLGNPNTTCSVHAVDVDNSCVESSVPGGEVLSAQFAKSNRETVTVGYGRDANVIGRLRTNSGDPVPGATLCVKMQTLGINSHPANVATVQTDTTGHYTYSVPPGPNRDVEIGYRHDTHQIVRDVRYYARARPSLKLAPAALHNGKRVHLWGHLPGPGAGRRVVIIQANAAGSTRWITFRKATTTKKGVFSTGYRFTSTTRKTRYRFRALVPRQAGYPWIEGHSKPAEVLVRR
jgi:hypothetical protein